MRFGDGVMINGTQLAIFLWRPAGSQPSIFLNGRVMQLDLDAILTPWRCSRCHGSHLCWGPRIQTRCATCQPPSLAEREFILAYTTGAVQHLADKLDDPAGKAAMYRLLDEAVASGDVRQLVRVSLEMLAGSFILKHELGHWL